MVQSPVKCVMYSIGFPVRWFSTARETRYPSGIRLRRKRTTFVHLLDRILDMLDYWAPPLLAHILGPFVSSLKPLHRLRRLLHHPPVEQMYRPVGIARVPRVVRDDADCRAAAVQLAKKIHY